jgi:hypothetical protein
VRPPTISSASRSAWPAPRGPRRSTRIKLWVGLFCWTGSLRH